MSAPAVSAQPHQQDAVQTLPPLDATSSDTEFEEELLSPERADDPPVSDPRLFSNANNRWRRRFAAKLWLICFLFCFATGAHNVTSVWRYGLFSGLLTPNIVIIGLDVAVDLSSALAECSEDERLYKELQAANLAAAAPPSFLQQSDHLASSSPFAGGVSWRGLDFWSLLGDFRAGDSRSLLSEGRVRKTGSDDTGGPANSYGSSSTDRQPKAPAFFAEEDSAIGINAAASTFLTFREMMRVQESDRRRQGVRVRNESATGVAAAAPVVPAPTAPSQRTTKPISELPEKEQVRRLQHCKKMLQIEATAHGKSTWVVAVVPLVFNLLGVALAAFLLQRHGWCGCGQRRAWAWTGIQFATVAVVLEVAGTAFWLHRGNTFSDAEASVEGRTMRSFFPWGLVLSATVSGMQNTFTRMGVLAATSLSMDVPLQRIPELLVTTACCPLRGSGRGGNPTTTSRDRVLLQNEHAAADARLERPFYFREGGVSFVQMVVMPFGLLCGVMFQGWVHSNPPHHRTWAPCAVYLLPLVLGYVLSDVLLINHHKSDILTQEELEEGAGGGAGAGIEGLESRRSSAEEDGVADGGNAFAEAGLPFVVPGSEVVAEDGVRSRRADKSLE